MGDEDVEIANMIVGKTLIRMFFMTIGEGVARKRDYLAYPVHKT